jgi:hypothetical protein
MNKFRELFKVSHNDPITYKGKQLYVSDFISVNKNDVLRVKVLSVNENRTQIFTINVDEPKNKKYLEVNGKRVPAIPFHERIMPKEGVEIKVLKDNIKLKVCNRGSFIWS